MDKYILILLFALFFWGCANENEKFVYQTEMIPSQIPLDFKGDLIPDNKIIHKGILSPDLKEYYYTVSDKDFQNFDTYVIRKLERNWSEPKQAFFNSEDDEHGMNFSPDGNTIYFSSTRPVNIDGISTTWHIWKADKINGIWSKPVFVDIPNLRDRLVSHPTITNSGTLYFHSSNLDYSEMNIYRSMEMKDGFGDAEEISVLKRPGKGNCTPFVSPKEDYLIFCIN